MRAMNAYLYRWVARLPRMAGWLCIALVLAAAVWLLAPQQLPVTLYKLSLVSMAAVAGYWLDRSLFPYARPDRVFRELRQAGYLEQCMALSAAMLRRALIVAAAMLAVGLGA